MFENTLITSTRKRRAICLGYIVEGLLLAVVVLVPLLHMQALPGLLIRTGLLPVPPEGSPPKTTTVRTVRRPNLGNFLTAPVSIPTMIPTLRPEPETSSDAFAAGPPGAVPWGSASGVPGGFGVNPFPPPPEPPAKPTRASRIIVGGVVEAARLIYEVQPEYPIIAKSAQVQGTVRLEAVIGKDGSVESLHAVSGPPLLIPAALRAVATWWYQPTLLNGVAVEVSTEIDVNFTLSE